MFWLVFSCDIISLVCFWLAGHIDLLETYLWRCCQVTKHIINTIYSVEYATSDDIGLIFCIHGLYFISDRTFSPFTRSFVLLLNLRWWNWSLVDIAFLVLEHVFLQSVLCKWNNLINFKSLFLILIYFVLNHNTDMCVLKLKSLNSL